MINESFEEFRNRLLDIDPVSFCERHLMLDGQPLRLGNSGFKPFADIYRYIAIKALEPDSKPVLLVKGRQVGGTTLASALEMYFVGCGLFGNNGKPPIRIIHAFPHNEAAKKYSKEKLNQLMGTSMPLGGDVLKGKSISYMENLLDKTNESNNSLEFKLFKGGNFIRIDSTGLDGGRLRGGTADVIFYDEVQDISAEAIGNTIEILKQANHGHQPGGIQVYFGTPKKKGSDYYKMWQRSSQQYYYLGCESCKKLFPLYTPESNEWEKIWIREQIVKCPHCEHEQDKLKAADRGKWIGTKDPNDPDVKYIGFHINQFYMPKIKREDIEAERPGIHPTNTERKFQNEVCGEFYQGDTSPISFEEVIEKCGDRDRKMRGRINPGEEQMVLLGIDYGLKSAMERAADSNRKDQGQSYTVAVILTVKGPGLFSVDYAYKFEKNDPEYKKGIIDTIMRQYSVDLAVGDIGYSNDISHTLHTMYGDKYLVSRAHNKLNGKVKFSADTYPKEIVFERDHYIGELFELLKKGQIKFPLKDYDRISWMIDQCTSMELKPIISRFGDPEVHYIKGAIGNDALMALINAYLAYKFLVTKGFSIKNPHLMKNPDNRNKNKPLAIFGNLKRKF